MEYSLTKSAKSFLLCILSTFLLFAGFLSNYWHVAEERWFVNHQIDCESLVVGRMVRSHQNGIFSDGGLTGMGSPNSTPADFERKTFLFQYQAYLNNLKFVSYSPYLSQTGGEGIFLSILDKLLPVSPKKKLLLFHALNSFCFALILSIIIIWFYTEFGLLTSFFVLASLVFSQWLVIFGRNLWWSMWVFYLPMAVAMYYLKRNRDLTNRQQVTLGILLFIAVAIKCFFNGYEYITTTLMMMMTPVVFYGIAAKWNFYRFLRVTIIIAFSSFLAVFLSLAVLCIQISIAKGSVLNGYDHIVYSLQKRTHAVPNEKLKDYAAGLESKTTTVVKEYLDGAFFDLARSSYMWQSHPFASRVFTIKYWVLIILFAITSIYLYVSRNRCAHVENERKIVALVLSTAFSILAPLSWFVIFKAHSYVHTHINYVVWQMPFTLFGFAVCGLGAKCALLKLANSLRQRTYIQGVQS